MNQMTPLGAITVEGESAAPKDRHMNRFASSPEVRQYIRCEIAEAQKRQPSTAASERIRAMEDVLCFIRSGMARQRWIDSEVPMGPG